MKEKKHWIFIYIYFDQNALKHVFCCWNRCLLLSIMVVLQWCITGSHCGAVAASSTTDQKITKIRRSLVRSRPEASTLCLLLIRLVSLQALAPWCMSACLDLVLLKPDLCTMEERVSLTCAQLLLTIIKALALVLTLTSPRLSMLRSSSNVTDELLLLL